MPNFPTVFEWERECSPLRPSRRLKFASFHGLFATHGRAHSPLMVRHIRLGFRHLYSKHNKLILKQQTVSVFTLIKLIINIRSQLVSVVIASMKIGFRDYCD